MPPPSTKKKSLASFFKQSTATNTRLTQREAIESERVEALKHRAVLEVEALQADLGGGKPDPAGPVPEEPGMPPPSTKKKSLASFFKQSTATNTRLTQREAIEMPTMAIKLSLNITYDRANLLILRERTNSGLFDPSTLSDYPELLIASPCQPPAGSSPTHNCP
ncbi:unnamed protein product [Boreogadus saida]